MGRQRQTSLLFLLPSSNALVPITILLFTWILVLVCLARLLSRLLLDLAALLRKLNLPPILGASITVSSSSSTMSIIDMFALKQVDEFNFCCLPNKPTIFVL